MKTKSEQKVQKKSIDLREGGNALIYVLIAIVLFAALGFSLTRQTRHGSTQEIDAAKIEMLATQMMSYAAQTQTAVEQMLITGATIDALDFTLPNQGGFNTAPHINKVYHPAGGGLSPANIPAQAINEIAVNPPAGWYLGAFNNVEWTRSTATDVILAAHQISRAICTKINERATGNPAIPAMNADPRTRLIAATHHTGGNANFTAANCAACEGQSTLCVSNSAATAFTFYSIVVGR